MLWELPTPLTADWISSFSLSVGPPERCNGAIGIELLHRNRVLVTSLHNTVFSSYYSPGAEVSSTDIFVRALMHPPEHSYGRASGMRDEMVYRRTLP